MSRFCTNITLMDSSGAKPLVSGFVEYAADFSDARARFLAWSETTFSFLINGINPGGGTSVFNNESTKEKPINGGIMAGFPTLMPTVTQILLPSVTRRKLPAKLTIQLADRSYLFLNLQYDPPNNINTWSTSQSDGNKVLQQGTIKIVDTRKISG